MRFIPLTATMCALICSAGAVLAKPKTSAAPFPSSGIWSTTKGGCADLKAYERTHGRQPNGAVRDGLQGSDGAFAHVTKGQIFWIESSCSIGKRGSNGARPLKCAGEGLYWSSSMRVANSSRLSMTGKHPAKGTYYFCR